MSIKKNLSIKLFNLKKMKESSNTLIVGMRASGKSTLVRDILYDKQTSYIGAVFSRTEALCKFYIDICPANTIFYDYNKYVVMASINNQIPSIHIMDDCLSSRRDWTTDQEIVDVMDRKNNMMNIFTIQFPLSFKKQFMESIDYIFFMHEAFISNRKRLHSYINFIEDFYEFDRIYDRIMKLDNFNIVVIDNTNTSSNIEDRLFWYKARVDLPRFEIKNYSDDIIISNYREDNESDSDESIGEKSSDSDRNVNKVLFESHKDNLTPNKVNLDSDDSSSIFTENNLDKYNINITINCDNIIINKNNTLKGKQCFP